MHASGKGFVGEVNAPGARPRHLGRGRLIKRQMTPSCRAPSKAFRCAANYTVLNPCDDSERRLGGEYDNYDSMAAKGVSG